mmetsp:Transcript_28032/g.89480  ORF Transcript_28032/g.89480 Transcript_28032/m.89480 type:complete len:233 (+) Transcript_28032:794-1492(+)
MDCHPAIIQLNKEFKLTATQLRAEVERRKDAGLPPLKGVIQSSPSNPTGSTLTPAEVEEMCAFCAAEGMWFLSDEIYHGINFGEQAASALRFPQYADNVMVLNSFSKYFSMTGWRLGWMVLPEGLVDSVYRLQQNMFINAPTLSQLAAVECFSEESIDELEGHVARYNFFSICACYRTHVTPCANRRPSAHTSGTPRTAKSSCLRLKGWRYQFRRATAPSTSTQISATSLAT